MPIISRCILVFLSFRLALLLFLWLVETCAIRPYCLGVFPACRRCEIARRHCGALPGQRETGLGCLFAIFFIFFNFFLCVFDWEGDLGFVFSNLIVIFAEKLGIMELRDRVNELLRQRGMTREMLQERMGIKITAYYSLFKNPSLSSLERLAGGLGVSLSELFAEGGDIGGPRVICPHCGGVIRIVAKK